LQEAADVSAHSCPLLRVLLPFPNPKPAFFGLRRFIAALKQAPTDESGDESPQSKVPCTAPLLQSQKSRE
jgi:hypothetical protein